MKVNGVHSLAWSRNAVIAFILVALAGTTPLSAQMWYESSPPIPRTYLHNQIAPAAFANTELNAELASLGPAQDAEPSCFCGKDISCECGSCDACCGCSHGLYGWCYRWISPWDGTLELGLNGADGNTSNSNLFFGFDGKREYRCS